MSCESESARLKTHNSKLITPPFHIYSPLASFRMGARSMKSCLFGLALIASAAFGTFAAAGAQPQSTVRQGVYTDAQAQRGAALYKSSCASCHGNTLQGGSAPPLGSADFVTTWSAEPLSELAGKIRNTMPQGSTVKLTRPQTADLVAFILQA